MFRPAHLFLGLFCLLFAGCLEFDGQEVTMRYDGEADRIDFLVVYRGIHYESGSDGVDVSKAFKDYDEALARGQSFFWSNWPLMVDAVKPDPRFAALAAHVHVENGGLFTGPTGRLDGYQFVRIRDAKEFIAKVNTMLELGVQAALLGGFRGLKFDRDTKEIAREFLRDGEKIFRVERGRLALHLPCSKADFGKLLRALEDHMAGGVASEIVRRFSVERRRAEDPEDISTSSDEEIVISRDQLERRLRLSASFRFFWDNEITIERDEELQVVGAGAEGNSELHVVKAPDGYYTDNFLKAARERGDKIEDGVPDQEIRRRFEDFLTREAVLPPELAAIRNAGK